MTAANIARLWVLGGAIAIVAILLGTWFIGISPRLSEAAAAEKSREAVQAQNDLHALKVAALTAQFEKIDELRADLGIAQQAVPAGYSQTEFLVEMQEIATATGVTIGTLSMSGAEVYVAPEIAVLEHAELAAAMVASSNGSFVAIPLSITASGPDDALLNFVGQLQSAKRYTLVNQVAISGETEEGQAGVVINAQIFALVDGPAILGEALPAEIPATPEPATQG